MIGILILAGGGFLFLRRGDDPDTNQPKESIESPLDTELEPSPDDSDGPTYTNTDYGFSFLRPEGMSIRTFEDEDGTVVLAEGSAEKQGFQIFITPFDEPELLTPARIKQDLPKKLIGNPKTATISGIQALVFSSSEPEINDTYEVWFIHEGYLYQIRAPLSFHSELNEMLNTWTF